MRLYEFAGPESAFLTEQILHETFMDSVKRFIGRQIAAPIVMVRDMKGAAQVIYKTIRSQQVLVSVTHELKEEVFETIAAVAKLPVISKLGGLFNKVTARLNALMANGYGIRDFLQSLGLVALVNMFKNLSVSLAVDKVKDRLMELVTKAGLLAEGVIKTVEFGGFLAILSGLRIADELVFETLNKINTKISAADYQHFDPNAPEQPEAPEAPEAAEAPEEPDYSPAAAARPQDAASRMSTQPLSRARAPLSQTPLRQTSLARAPLSGTPVRPGLRTQ